MTRVDAEQAWDLAKSSPADGLRLGSEVLASSDDVETRSIAQAAKGRACYELGRNEEAIADLRSAVSTSTWPFRGHVELALAAALAAKGELTEAEDLLQPIIDAPGDEPALRGLALSQLGYLCLRRGQMEQACDLMDRSLPLLSGDREIDARARTLLNFGYCTLMLGQVDRSLALFELAIDLGRRNGQDLLVAACLQNRAYGHTLLGELPSALAELDQAMELYGRTGDPGRLVSSLYDDFAETYRLAGLTGDAVRLAEQALASIDGGGNVEQRADASYRLAVCLLDHGDHERASQVADEAADTFERSGRSLWATRATLVSVEATAPESVDQVQIDRAERAIEELDRSGWRTEALQLRNRLILLALAGGDHDTVERFALGQLPDDDHSVTGELHRLLHTSALALQRDDATDPALGNARSLLMTHRLRLGDPELRAGTGRMSEAFRFIALAHALKADRPDEVLRTEEAWRATALRLPRPRPSADPMVAEVTRELRDATRRAAEADAPDAELDGRIEHLEQRLRRVSHRLAGDDRLDTELSDGEGLVDRLHDRLGDRELIEWFEHRGELNRLSVVDGEVRFDRVGPLTDVRARASRLSRDLTRLLQTSRADDRAERWRRITNRAGELGRLLLGDRPRRPGLVLCPPGPLLELPWSLLVPGVTPPTNLSFSAATWRGQDGAIPDPAIDVVVGPDLAHGAADLETAVASFTSATQAARADHRDLVGALGRADLVHIAAHGRFRSDSPMFSSIRLHDGEFALHELAEFERVPSVVTLAACDAGRSQHLGGSEQLGAAPAWLSAGVDTVIAPICAVPDEATATFFHHVYAALPGSTPAEAVAVANAELADADPVLAATAAAFLCFGSGGPVIGRADAAST